MRLRTVRRSFTIKEVKDETQSETQVGTPAAMATGSVTDACCKCERLVLVAHGLGDLSVDTGSRRYYFRNFLSHSGRQAEYIHSAFRIPHLG